MDDKLKNSLLARAASPEKSNIEEETIEQDTPTIRKTNFAAEPNGTLEIDASFESIVIDTQAHNRVDVNVICEVDDRFQGDANIILDEYGVTTGVESGRDVHVRPSVSEDAQRRWKKEYATIPLQVRIEVLIPEKYNGVIKTTSGSIHVKRAGGNIQAGAQSGSIHLGTVGGSVVVGTTSGSIAVDTVRGGSLKAGAQSGSIHLSTMDGSVDVGTTSGSITVDTVGGSVKAGAQSGSIHLGTVGGSVVVGTTSGSITVDTVGGKVRAGSQSGSIGLGPVGGNVDVGTTSGSITVDAVGGSVKASTTSGSIRLSGAGGSIDSTTASGSIDVGEAGGGVKATAKSGNITVRLSEGAAVNIDAVTVDHPLNFSSEFEVKGSTSGSRLRGTINGGGPQYTLQTTSGKIRIQKQNATPSEKKIPPRTSF